MTAPRSVARRPSVDITVPKTPPRSAMRAAPTAIFNPMPIDHPIEKYYQIATSFIIDMVNRNNAHCSLSRRELLIQIAGAGFCIPFAGLIPSLLASDQKQSRSVAPTLAPGLSDVD